MRVHELIAILQKMEPDAEIMVGSHTLKHNNSNHGKCSDPIGTWPAMAVEVGAFPHGGPLDQDHWVTIVASDVWGCTFVDSQGIKRRTPISAPSRPVNGPLRGPFRKVISKATDQYGARHETLECGHTVNSTQDFYNHTNALRRRCKHCLKENQSSTVDMRSLAKNLREMADAVEAAANE